MHLCLDAGRVDRARQSECALVVARLIVQIARRQISRQRDIATPPNAQHTLLERDLDAVLRTPAISGSRRLTDTGTAEPTHHPLAGCAASAGETAPVGRDPQRLSA